MFEHGRPSARAWWYFARLLIADLSAVKSRAAKYLSC